MVPHLGFEPKPLLYEGSVPATGRVTKMAGDRKIEFRSEVLETSVIPDHPLWGTRQDSNLHRTFVQPAFVARRLIQFTPLVHYKTWSARRDLNSRELAPRASASIQARLRADNLVDPLSNDLSFRDFQSRTLTISVKGPKLLVETGRVELPISGCRPDVFPLALRPHYSTSNLFNASRRLRLYPKYFR